MTTVVPIVLSGGSGTRLWPLSREGHPKPFIELSDGESLLEKTYRRLQALDLNKSIAIKPILTVTNRDYFFLSRDTLAKVTPQGSFLLEPQGRNTAPAIGIAAQWVKANYGADAVMLIMPADHLITHQEQFAQAVKQAIEIAHSGYLVTFGIVPAHADTGFGYIECGSQIMPGAHEVAQFIEKPPLKKAEQLVMSGNHLWNAGMFCFTAHQILQELKNHQAKLYEGIQTCWDTIAQRDHTSLCEIPAAGFAELADISIDYAVMEHSHNVVVLPVDFGWNDIGTWQALSQLTAADSEHNRVVGDAVLVDTHHTFIQSQNRLIAALGVRDLVIVDTPDALLVSHIDAVQRVKEVVGILRERKHDSAVVHATVVRPWGAYTVLEEGPGFKVKRIEVNPGASLSLQMHHHRSEHWIVVQGLATVVNGENTFEIAANQSTYIPAGHRHRLSNFTQEPLVMIEVQSGAYLGEDDIVRFSDDYGRQ